MKGLFYRILFAWKHSFRSNNPGRWVNCWKASQFVFPEAPDDDELLEIYFLLLGPMVLGLAYFNRLI